MKLMYNAVYEQCRTHSLMCCIEMACYIIHKQASVTPLNEQETNI